LKELFRQRILNLRIKCHEKFLISYFRKRRIDSAEFPHSNPPIKNINDAREGTLHAFC